MQIDTLYFLIELSETQSLTQVARKMNITPSALSQTISHLEEEWGLKLFNRTPAGTFVTAEGQVMIESARQVIESYSFLLERVKLLHERPESSLKIGVSNEVPKFLLDLMLQYQEQYEDFKIEISEYQSNEIIKFIEEKALDLGLVYVTTGQLKRLSHYHFHELQKDQIKLFMGQTHYLANQEDIDLDLLLEQDFILFKDEHIIEMVREFQVKYGTIKIMTTTSSIRVLLEMLTKFQGVSFIRKEQIKQNLLDVPENTLIEKDLEMLEYHDLSYGLIYRKDHLFTSLETQFMNEIKQYFY